MKKTILAFLLFISFIFCFKPVWSQSPWFHYNWGGADKNTLTYLPDYVYGYDMSAYKDNMFIGKFYKKFTQECVSSLAYNINRGYYFPDFDNYGPYLKKVLEAVIGDTSVSNKIKIIIKYNTDLNAAMNESGIMELNIGTLAKLDNEAQLAALFAHEVSHFLNQDAVKHYGNLMDTYYNQYNAGLFEYWSFGYRVGNFGVGGFSYNPKFAIERLYWNNRADEKAADFSAINYLKKSGYSLKGCSDLFKKFKRNEIKNTILYGEQNDVYSTHPDPGERMKQVKYLSSDSLNVGKKLFLVDSTKFERLQKMAFDECININFISQDIDENIEMAFKQYLFEPDNINILQVLIDELRRLELTESGNIGKSPFILYKYQTKHVKGSKSYDFLNTDNPSVLSFLTKGFIDIGKEDLKKVKAIDLLDTNTTVFITNTEAYGYFLNKANEQKCITCNPLNVLTQPYNNNKISQYISSNSVLDINPYLKSLITPDTFNHSMVIVRPCTYSLKTDIYNEKTPEEQKLFYDSIVNIIKIKTGLPAIKQFDLPFYDQHILGGIVRVTYLHTEPKKNMGIKKNSKNWLASSPELYNLFSRNKVSTIYICDANLFIENKKDATYIYKFLKISANSGQNNMAAELIGNKKETDGNINWFYRNFGYDVSEFFRMTK